MIGELPCDIRPLRYPSLTFSSSSSRPPYFLFFPFASLQLFNHFISGLDVVPTQLIIGLGV